MRFILNPDQVKLAAGVLQRQCHGLAKASGWWVDLATGRDCLRRVVGGPGRTHTMSSSI